MRVHIDLEMENSIDERLYNLVKTKGPLSYMVCENGFKWFGVIKGILEQTAIKLREDIHKADPKIVIEYSHKGDNQVQIRIADDVIVFHLQTNVFRFEESHSLGKSAYIKANPLKGHCCIINVYNFIADSITQKRENDFGILIARVFINVENHFFVEGKKQVGILFDDFANDIIDAEKIEKLLKSLIVFCLEHDLITPPFESVQTITLNEIINNTFTFLSNSKRLGFEIISKANTKA